MIDGFRRTRHTARPGLRPVDQHHAAKIVVGDHTTPIPPQRPFMPASAPEASGPADTGTDGQDGGGKPPKKSFKDRLRSLSKKQWMLIIVALVLLITGIVAAVIMLQGDPPVKQATTAKPQKKVAPPKPKTVASVMSGLQVAPDVNERPVTGVMIENSESARPQSGLDEADVIFEAIAEGGITRFLVLFHDYAPAYVGPVRSVRPYYIQWGMGFDAAIAHVGGSAEALQNMKSWNAKDLDQFANSSYFHRISSRYAPHNMYTSIGELNALETKQGYGKANFVSLTRKAEAPSTLPTAKTIDIAISSAVFNSHYDYDAASNSYKRSQAGAPHNAVNEAGTQKQLQPKVVVALVMSQGIAPDGVHTAYGAIGSGQVYVFQDGNVTEGTWKKPDRGSQVAFTDAGGNPIAVNPGQTWFTAVGAANRVNFKP